MTFLANPGGLTVNSNGTGDVFILNYDLVKRSAKSYFIGFSTTSGYPPVASISYGKEALRLLVNSLQREQ
jgi:hypothetical protein